MGYESIIDVNVKLKKIRTLKGLYKILNQNEVGFLQDDYEDLKIEKGYLVFDEYYRKNYDSENWISIIQKISKVEKQEVEITFEGEDYECWGWRADKAGKIVELEKVWRVRI